MFLGVNMLKVLIVDDSTFMRSILNRMLTSDPDIEVVGQARDGVDALEKIASLNPDVITLDIDMPRMNGHAVLAELMKTNPKPVIVISSLTCSGADETLKALELGALDYMPKYQEGSIVFAVAQEELVNKVKAIAKKAPYLRLVNQSQKGAKVSPSIRKSSLDVPTSAVRPARSANVLNNTKSPSSFAVKIAPPVNTSGKQTRNIIVLGVSTGGPPAVQKVLADLPTNFPACILIAQHMPGAFTNAFAKRLDSLCQITVKEAQDGDKLLNGIAYVCPGGQHISIMQSGAMPLIKISKDPEGELYKPAVNILNASASILGSKVVGLTMTGMGNDGLEGTKVLKAKGGYIIAQDEESCVVYGMPRAVIDANLVDEIVPLGQIASALQKALYR